MFIMQNTSSAVSMDKCFSQNSFVCEDEAKILRSFITQLSLYDSHTSLHTRRMVQLTVATAHNLHLSKKDIQHTRLATLLHDVGKVAVPTAILHKPGPLTTEEWRIMRSHPEIGYRMLMNAGGVFVLLAPIVIAHHERWNGSGYPFGLAQESIPIVARILAVVDSYDAMTSVRPYHEPLSSIEACAELQRCAGSLYDPHIVASFLSALSTRLAKPATLAA